MMRLLEEDIEELRVLDDQRERCRGLLNDAALALVKWTQDAGSRQDEDWESAEDDVERAMVLRSLNLIDRHSLLRLTEEAQQQIQATTKTLREILFATHLGSLYDETSSRDNDRIPVFRACHISQALVEDEHQNSGPFCGASLNCLYRLMTEVFRAEGPEWKIGGVRASLKAPQSSFVTREAVRSMLLVRESLANTVQLLDELYRAKQAWNASQSAPSCWRTQISDLRRRSFETSLRARWPHLLDRSIKTMQPGAGDWTDKVCIDTLAQLRGKWSAFRANLNSISPPAGDLVSPAVHERVIKLLEGVHNAAGTEIIESSGDLRKVNSALREAAAHVLRILDPTLVYLETVLVEELSAKPSRTAVSPDPAQAGFAAAALAEIARASDSLDPNDPRLRAAAELASSMLSERGALPSQSPFDVSGKGYRLPPQSAETVRATCDMLRLSTSDCDPESARRLVRYFLETRADRPGTQPGWHSDAVPRQPKAEVWATALAFLALFDLGMMLDLQINRRVLRHFAMRRPRELKLGLDQLFLPDAVSALKDPERSIGVQLQRMRAHVEGITSSGDDFSFVLYGPPGTGKSTLLEAVAKSSACAYVEITPSDILIGGTEQIERRTRVVFSALSMLSHCVILFDEFDSILRTRSRDRGPIRSQFQFLTPGLLPKLKYLHERAEKQRLAYALATNYVGDLDRAAIRRGRFDRQLGIFPPDLLSRVGRLATEMWTYHGKELNTEEVKRAFKVINASAGYGMATLGKPGWFTAPRRDAQLAGTLFGYILEHQANMPELGEREDEKPKEKPNEQKTPPVGLREWKEWNAVEQLDNRGKQIQIKNWEAYVQEVTTLSQEAPPG